MAMVTAERLVTTTYYDSKAVCDVCKAEGLVQTSHILRFARMDALSAARREGWVITVDACLCRACISKRGS